MRKIEIVAVLMLALLLVSCAQHGVVEHDGTELTPSELESLYESRQEQTPEPDVLGKQTVYWTPSGTKYHRDPDCTHLKRASAVYQGTMAEAANHGADSPCSRCAGG